MIYSLFFLAILSFPQNFFDGLFWSLFGFTLPFLPNSAKYLWNLTKKPYLADNWHIYFYTNEDRNQYQITGATWAIKKGFKNKFNVIESRESVPNLSYEGYINLQENILVAKLQCSEHSETVFLQIYNPIRSQKDITTGFSISIDFNKHLLARGVVLSKKQLTTDQVKQVISTKLICLSKEKILIMYP
ncbi:MAG: hypothetical protein IT270_07495 [Saprospiraceae bacterium]|nr:hypothetical protein [Saprospiraceae bacterium]